MQFVIHKSTSVYECIADKPASRRHPRQGFVSDCHRCAGPCPRGRSGPIFPSCCWMVSISSSASSLRQRAQPTRSASTTDSTIAIYPICICGRKPHRNTFTGSPFIPGVPCRLHFSIPASKDNVLSLTINSCLMAGLATDINCCPDNWS